MGAIKLTYQPDEITANLRIVHKKGCQDLCSQKTKTSDFLGLDCYPFGSIMPGRNFSSNSYRYSFQGMEKDDEITGITGSHYTTYERPYDARLGRWWAVDPEKDRFAGWSPYRGFLDNPINYVDEGGDTEWKVLYVHDARSGKTSMSVATAPNLMTDGRKYARRASGDYDVFVNKYYDYKSERHVFIDKQGNISGGKASSEILYSRGTQDEEYVWFGGDDYGDTKLDWDDLWLPASSQEGVNPEKVGGGKPSDDKEWTGSDWGEEGGSSGGGSGVGDPKLPIVVEYNSGDVGEIDDDSYTYPQDNKYGSTEYKTAKRGDTLVELGENDTTLSGSQRGGYRLKNKR